ncbi:Mitochondrial import receptor subunit [Aspergillus sclerotialis]|uniref:Mitochondrial import receptor subunit n=1 Tax=Aspergillus sclerotialis TaxID=2070753 RepID=A0A3A3AB12_9EURO|nr:Mitochondrial import receptor subunit [Aspergillus sclerotialis]
MLELHVWGPAFSLPSIDAQCLATIAYFTLAVPKDAWVLVASSDPSVSPTNELPAVKNGSTWVSRFGNIVDYLRQYSGGEWDLDADLGELDRADNIAFSSFITARAQPLIDLSLYVTSQNYRYQTSPAYAAILTWPNQWIIPPKLHTAAKARTDHLGLSSLDLEAIEDQRNREHSAAVAAGHIPRNFIQRPRDTVSSLLGKTSQQNQFKVEALTAEIFEPLEEMLTRDNKQKSQGYFLAHDTPSSLDALAVGYLSVALIPDLKHPWLHDAMRSKAPVLTAYITRLRTKCFGDNPITPSLALSPSPNTPTALPWRAPERPSLPKIGTTILNTVADATPIWKDFRTNARIKSMAESKDSGLSEQESKTLSEFAKQSRSDLVLSIATVGAGVIALVGYMMSVGLFARNAEKMEAEEDQEDYEINANQTADFLSGLGV